MAQSNAAVKNVAQMPQKGSKQGGAAKASAPGAPRIRKDGEPYAERGDSLRWNAERDAALLAALAAGAVNLVQLSKALHTAEAFAGVQHLITVPRLRTRVNTLRKAQKEQGVEVIPARFERQYYKPDLKALRASQ